jgi:heme/copper-type cytochrome/quinol oxidase subunit 3
MSEQMVTPDASLPVGAIGYRSSGWWGAIFFVLSEASIFAYLFFVYFYFYTQPDSGGAPPAPPDLTYALAQTLVILLGCATAWWASRAVRGGASMQVLLALAVTAALGCAFVALQLLEWYSKPYSLSTSAYSSIYFTIGGFHLAHVVAGCIMFLALLAWTALGYFDQVRNAPITVGAFYSYFLAIVWLAVFFVIYLTPYLA